MKTKQSKLSIPFDTRAKLGYYIYALRDPQNKQVFYIGKGKGERILQHVIEAGNNAKSEKAKLARIREIEGKGRQVEHLFIRTGITTEAEAFAIEQAVIDAFAAGKVPLANLVAGHESSTVGLASLETVLGRFASAPTPAVPVPLIMFKINRKWSPEMSTEDIYEITRGHWKIGKNSMQHAQLALAVSFGVVRGVFEIEPNSWQKSKGKDLAGRYNFTGTSSKKYQHLIGTMISADLKNQTPFQVFLSELGYNPKKGK